MRTNNVADVQHKRRIREGVIRAKRLSLKENEALAASIRKISK
jgi:hypothetical protein